MIRARVLTQRDEARVALAVSGLAAAFLAAVLADDVFRVRFFRPAHDLAYAAVAIVIALAGIAPWLAWTRRGKAVLLTAREGAVVGAGLHLRASEVGACRVVRARRGHSIALSRRGSLVFLEVEDDAAVAQITSALGVPAGGRGELALPVPRRRLAAVQAVLCVVALTCAPLYWLAASGAGFPFADKATAGISGVLSAIVGFFVLLARQLGRREVVAIRRGAWDEHVALHTHREQAGSPEPRSDEMRRSLLARGDEPIRVWLARLDTPPREGHAYRAPALAPDVLWEALRDDEAGVDERMAAARVLAKRHGAKPAVLVRVVGDPDVRARVEAVLEDEEEVAERRLASLGPLFRARS